MRFVYSILIVIYHGRILEENPEKWTFCSGFIGVEFFFVVSGYFMASYASKKCLRNDLNLGQETLIFIKQKYKSLLPELYISWIFSFALIHSYSNSSLHQIISDFVNSIWEILLISHSGMRAYVVNSPLWYLSAMLICMTIIYPLMVRYKDTFFCIISPVSSLVLFGYLFQNIGRLDNASDWNGLFFIGTIRGAAEILLGSIIYKISAETRKKKVSFFGKFIFTAAEWSINILVVFYAWLARSSIYDFFILLLISVSVLISASEISFSNKLFNNRFTFFLGQYSFSLFLIHICWRNFFQNVELGLQSYQEKNMMYLLLSFSSALILMLISKLTKTFFPSKKIKGVLKNIFLKEDDKNENSCVGTD